MHPVSKCSDSNICCTLDRTQDWVDKTAANVTGIDVEGNQIRLLPKSLPPALRSLRLGGNPIAGKRRPSHRQISLARSVL
eukprot:SAG22_NODE_1680_length_3824_cov_1.537181_3_plen_80_part_00